MAGTTALGRRTKPRKRFDSLPILLILPTLLILGALLFYPILRGVQLSFFEVKLLDRTGGTFVGFENYLNLFNNDRFWDSLKITVWYTLGVVGFSYFIGLGTALLLSRRIPLRGVFRTLMVIPWAVPEVVAVLIFVWMFDAQYGVFNYFLMQLGIIDEQLPWLVRSNLALPAIIIVTVWKQFPLATVIILAGLQTIPEEYYEAASIDGANWWQRFRFITWPGLRAINIVLILILILNSFRRVTIIFAMTGGGPARATETLSIQMYLEAFKFFNLGDAATIGTVVLLLLIAFTLIYFRVTYGQQEEAA
jgi:multiple sugar transport system permease protein